MAGGSRVFHTGRSDARARARGRAPPERQPGVVAARSASDGALSETAQDERHDGTAVRAGGGAHNETSAVIEPSSDGIDPLSSEFCSSLPHPRGGGGGGCE